MIDKITINDWPDTTNVEGTWKNREVPKPSRRNLEFLAEKFNALLDFVYSNEPLCPCGSTKKYRNCCGEV